MDLFLVAAFMGLLALLYATVGAGRGNGVAAMALFAFPPDMMRPTSLLLNVVGAGYTTWRLHRAGAIDWSTHRPIVAASLPMAFIGGLLVLPPQTFRIVVGVVLIVAAALTVRRSKHSAAGVRPVRLPLAAAIGGGVGLASGLTGVGGGVFLAPLLLVGGWATPKQTVGLSAPFILANSTVAFIATRLAGQTVADGTPIYAIGSLAGAALGTAIGLRWMSPRMIRLILAAHPHRLRPPHARRMRTASRRQAGTR